MGIHPFTISSGLVEIGRRVYILHPMGRGHSTCHHRPHRSVFLDHLRGHRSCKGLTVHLAQKKTPLRPFLGTRTHPRAIRTMGFMGARAATTNHLTRHRGMEGGRLVM